MTASAHRFSYEVTVDQGTLESLMLRLVLRRVGFVVLPHPQQPPTPAWLIQVKTDDWPALEEEMRYLETRTEGEPTP